MPDWRASAHALTFGAYLAAMACVLFLAGAFAYGGFYLVLLTALLWLNRRRHGSPSSRTAIQENLFYPVALNTTFPAMGGAIPAVRELRYDDSLLAIDRFLCGTSPNVWAERFVAPVLTELMSLCYFFFMPLLFFSLVRYFFRRRELLDPFYRGLFVVYGIGFLGYLCVPAAGPYLAHPELFSVPLIGGPATALVDTMVRLGSNRVDVFPSLHCAVSAYILGFAHRHHRREFRWLLLPVLGLWLSTLYLRYHYLVDVICGFALAWLGLVLSRSDSPIPDQEELADDPAPRPEL